MSFFLLLVEKLVMISPYLSSMKGGSTVFPFLHPRVPDFVLGLTIGLSLALAWHWVAWTIR